MIGRRIQIVPRNGEQLYSLLVKKEIELRRRNTGTFRRAAGKQKNRTKWMHASYPGWIKMQRTIGGGIAAEIGTKGKAGGEWQIIHAFLGFVDRHFADHVESVNIQYVL